MKISEVLRKAAYEKLEHDIREGYWSCNTKDAFACNAISLAQGMRWDAKRTTEAHHYFRHLFQRRKIEYGGGWWPRNDEKYQHQRFMAHQMHRLLVSDD